MGGRWIRAGGIALLLGIPTAAAPQAEVFVDADAVLELPLAPVDVPTVAEPLGRVVVAVEDAAVQLGLTPPEFAMADFSGDGAVALDDFFAFADHFGGRSRRYDLDGDGDVDLDDFFIFADRYGTGAE